MDNNMAIQLVRETAVCLDFTGEWSWADFRNELVQVVETLDHPSDVILNFNDSFVIPRDLLSIAGHARNLNLDNLQTLILVSDNHPFLQTIAEIFAGLNKGFAQKYKLVSTLDQAVGQSSGSHQVIDCCA